LDGPRLPILPKINKREGNEIYKKTKGDLIINSALRSMAALPSSPNLATSGTSAIIDAVANEIPETALATRGDEALAAVGAEKSGQRKIVKKKRRPARPQVHYTRFNPTHRSFSSSFKPLY